MKTSKSKQSSGKNKNYNQTDTNIADILSQLEYQLSGSGNLLKLKPEIVKRIIEAIYNSRRKQGILYIPFCVGYESKIPIESEEFRTLVQTLRLLKDLLNKNDEPNKETFSFIICLYKNENPVDQKSVNSLQTWNKTIVSKFLLREEDYEGDKQRENCVDGKEWNCVDMGRWRGVRNHRIDEAEKHLTDLRGSNEKFISYDSLFSKEESTKGESIRVDVIIKDELERLLQEDVQDYLKRYKKSEALNFTPDEINRTIKHIIKETLDMVAMLEKYQENYPNPERSVCLFYANPVYKFANYVFALLENRKIYYSLKQIDLRGSASKGKEKWPSLSSGYFKETQTPRMTIQRDKEKSNEEPKPMEVEKLVSEGAQTKTIVASKSNDEGLPEKNPTFSGSDKAIQELNTCIQSGRMLGMTREEFEATMGDFYTVVEHKLPYREGFKEFSAWVDKAIENKMTQEGFKKLMGAYYHVARYSSNDNKQYNTSNRVMPYVTHSRPIVPLDPYRSSVLPSSGYSNNTYNPAYPVPYGDVMFAPPFPSQQHYIHQSCPDVFLFRQDGSSELGWRESETRLRQALTYPFSQQQVHYDEMGRPIYLSHDHKTIIHLVPVQLTPTTSSTAPSVPQVNTSIRNAGHPQPVEPSNFLSQDSSIIFAQQNAMQNTIDRSGYFRNNLFSIAQQNQQLPQQQANQQANQQPNQQPNQQSNVMNSRPSLPFNHQ